MKYSLYVRNDRTTIFDDEGRVLGTVTKTGIDSHSCMFVNKSLAFETIVGRFYRWADAVEMVHAAGTAARS